MKVLIAGAGGALGRKLIHGFLNKGMEVLAIAFSTRGLSDLHHPRLTTLVRDVTKPGQLAGLCRGVDLVVSCLGITKARHRTSHMEVDYGGNLNLLREAEAQGVAKFSFITPAGTPHGKAHGVPLLHAKALFKNELKQSGIKWVIFRSGGFFSDLAEMGKMAKGGTMFVVGSGTNVFTPVDVDEVSRIMVDDSLAKSNVIVEIGGPEDMSWDDICKTCFAHYGKKPRIVHIPAWTCSVPLAILKLISSPNFAMGKLILFMSTHDLPTEKRGVVRFADYLADQNRRSA